MPPLSDSAPAALGSLPTRRQALGTALQAGAALLMTGTLAAEGRSSASGDSTIFQQDLPDLTIHSWQMTAIEVSYKPGEMDLAHRHPGFVFGYVIEGDLKFQVDGGKETTYRAGQMFYEAPGGVHRISGNASATRPCRLLAMIFADKQSPLVSPA
ncbi:MAG: cupin domain-containing protein [Gemmatimonadota bacterium]